jgi:hypothetical protein
MAFSISKFWGKKYFTEELNSFSQEYIEQLKKEILESKYLAKNHLNYNFSSTLGFSVIFKTNTKDKVIEKFPIFKPYIDRIFSEDINAYYLNPLVLQINSKVDKHLDLSLRSYYLPISVPERVSVLYVDIPEMYGGNLILYKEEKFIAKINPEINKLLIFNGNLKHEVTSISEIRSENKQQRISLICEQYSLNKYELSQIPDFLIRSATSFNNFLEMEKNNEQ